MYVFSIFGACLVLIVSHSTALDFSLLPKFNELEKTLAFKEKLVSSCKACSNLVTSFLKAVDRTNRHSFQGGDAAWESEKLGRYENSELRFIEIQEMLCIDVTHGKDQCYDLAERHEEKLETWFYKKRKQNVDFFTFLCLNELKVCCPENTYGPKCLPCPGGVEKPCSGHGKCQNAGTREESAHCLCDVGYFGYLCNHCEIGYYPNENVKNVNCEECDKACESYCRGPGPKNCGACAAGYNFQESEGCVFDSNSLKITNDGTNETDEHKQSLEHELDNVTVATSQADHSEL